MFIINSSLIFSRIIIDDKSLNINQTIISEVQSLMAESNGIQKHQINLFTIGNEKSFLSSLGFLINFTIFFL
jgi:hypothetical protein